LEQEALEVQVVLVILRVLEVLTVDLQVLKQMPLKELHIIGMVELAV
jgi:hypothetical protein